MIFFKEINPRDYTDFWTMIQVLQDKCLVENGTRFDLSKIEMGQVSPNSELFWFRSLLKIEDGPKALKEKLISILVKAITDAQL